MTPVRLSLRVAVTAIFMLCASLASHSVAWAQDAPIVSKLSDNTYSVFWGFFNSLVVIGNKGVLITDPANDNRAAVLKAEIAKLTDLPVTYIVLSHEHFDHIGGVGAFPQAKLVAQKNIHAVLPLDPLDLAPDDIDITFENKYTLNMGTTDVEMHFMGAGDGVATTVVYMPWEGIAFTADLYEDKRLTPASFLDDTNMLGVRRILNRIGQWPIKHAVTAHSLSSDPQILRDNIRYINDLYDAVYPPIAKAAASDNPFAIYGLLDSLPDTVTLEAYADWDGYEHFSGHVRRMALSIIHGG
ncbi:MBL fold metallo-hydrolase [Candidatus Puniceispirillum marinum]|uniref:Zn-dependent Hydrolase n=1 Tax=Puniceispirillum marinum (strain IMCC1322) TaxID=488538 RepID=D5BNK7_PUNMI|nr:MBL fold metallo-hydrolase [Candidatus Puniceispirillum marinum]ADE38274.1 Zn-dependent Hydrolase [Candidatus Puniceispirillum marinum IMCC1322]